MWTYKFFLQKLLLILLRIISACLSGLPINLLDIDTISQSLVPYFSHPQINVRIAARNSAQFLINEGLAPSVKERYTLTKGDVEDILPCSGKEMPVSAVLRLLLSFSVMPHNREVIKEGGGFLLAISVASCSKQSMETNLAFALMQSLSIVGKHCDLSTDSLPLGREVTSTPDKHVSSLEAQLESLQFPLVGKTCATIQSLLQQTSEYEVSLDKVESLVSRPLLQVLSGEFDSSIIYMLIGFCVCRHMCTCMCAFALMVTFGHTHLSIAIHFIVVQEEWEDFDQVRLSVALASCLCLFWMKFVAKCERNVSSPVSLKLLESLQMILCSLRFPGRASLLSVSEVSIHVLVSVKWARAL